MWVRNRRRDTRLVLRSAVVTLAAVSGTACATWRVAEESPQEVFAAESRPAIVRITSTDGEQTILTRPRVLGDVLAGFDDECARNSGRGVDGCEEMGIPVFEIAVLEVRRRGLAAIVLPAVGGLGIAWLLANR